MTMRNKNKLMIGGFIVASMLATAATRAARR
jgi:hypothetical protein